MNRAHLTPEDYAAMAVAAAELAGASVGARAEMNKALSERYRAFSRRAPVAAGAQPINKCAGEV